MNAAERLWGALAARDWDALRAQFQANAEVEWPASGERMDVEGYVGAQRERRGDEAVVVRRVAGEGDLVAVDAAIGAARCGGFYDLHAGRIQFATEYWTRRPGDR